jgi:hypothetical protein
MSDACAQPLDLATLVDYWLEDEASPDRESVEEHLIGCEGCSRRLQGLVSIGEGVRRVAQEGAVQVVVTPAFLEQAAREGLRTREYRVTPGGRVACTVLPEDDLVVGRLQGDFTGVSRLDVVSFAEGWPEERLADIPFSPDAPELIVAQAMPALRAMRESVIHMRLLAQEEGSERLLGEYTFAHSPTLR